MRTHHAILTAAAALVGGLSAQDAPTPLEFQAASVKLSEHAEPVRGVSPRGLPTSYFYSGCSGGPGSTDPVRFTCTNINLRHLIEDAWSLRSYQLTGPDTLDSATYDIEAKVAAGTTEDQFKSMLQKLLIDRFHLAVHHEKREEAYVLSIGKGGHKLQVPPPGDTESARDALTNNPNGDGKARSNSVDGLPPERAAIRDEIRSMLAERMAGRAGRAGPPLPQHIAMSSSNGLTRLAGRQATMADLTRWLSRSFNCPVVDHTDLTGAWNFMVEYGSEGGWGGGPMDGPVAAMRQSMGNTASAGDSTEPSTPSGLPSIFVAFQKQLGLKLEAAKEPGDMLVVDKVSRTPVAN